MAKLPISKLASLVSQEQDSPVPTAPMPRPSGVLYATPNPDGTRKSCGSCALWAERDQRCLIHGPEMEVVAEGVCGYHVFGEPSLFTSAVSATPVDPSLSGYEVVPEGTSCDRCRFFYDGECLAVADPALGRPPAQVEPLGCCARWEPRK